MNDEVVHIRPRKAEALKVGYKVFKSAYDSELTDKDLEKAACELGETEEKKKASLRELKEKLSKESNVKYRQDDFYLLRFLRVRKYDVQKAFHNVKHFFEVRRELSNYFTLPRDLKSAYERGLITILPYTNEEGTIIFWLNLSKWDPAEMSLEELIQMSTTLCDIVSMNPHCHINGTMSIWNFSGLSMRHFSELLKNGRLWGIISIFQSGYPWRINKLIFINTNRVVRLAYSMVRSLLQKKIAEIVVLLGSDLTELHQHVNPVLLPESLRGTLKDKACDISQHILDNLPYLKYERTFIFA